jgi:hypothetical protein
VAQEWRCYYCDGGMLWVEPDPLGRPGPNVATFEHLKKRAHGGSHDIDNGAAACSACNNARRDFEPEEWRTLRRQLLPIWPACTAQPHNIKRVLTYLDRVIAQATLCGIGFEWKFTKIPEPGYTFSGRPPPVNGPDGPFGALASLFPKTIVSEPLTPENDGVSVFMRQVEDSQ